MVAYFWNAILMHFQFLCEFEILGKLILQNYCSAYYTLCSKIRTKCLFTRNALFPCKLPYKSFFSPKFYRNVGLIFQLNLLISLMTKQFQVSVKNNSFLLLCEVVLKFCTIFIFHLLELPKYPKSKI